MPNLYSDGLLLRSIQEHGKLIVEPGAFAQGVESGRKTVESKKCLHHQEHLGGILLGAGRVYPTPVYVSLSAGMRRKPTA